MAIGLVKKGVDIQCFQKLSVVPWSELDVMSDTVAHCIYTNIMLPHMTPNWERMFWVKECKSLMTERQKLLRKLNM